MKICALASFDPASVILSHRDLMRAAGHDMRLAVVRAYTERQRQADYVCEQVAWTSAYPRSGGQYHHLQKLSPDLESLREFAASADVIQFHPGIGTGEGSGWASQSGALRDPGLEFAEVLAHLGVDVSDLAFAHREIYFVHGSRAAWANRQKLVNDLHDFGKRYSYQLATSTIDYAHELGAAYLPPLVDVGDLRAPLRGDDDPLLVAHTPTDRVACSTEEFLKAVQALGIPVRLGEGIPHDEVLRLKAECNAGFDHLRGAFSANTLENAALGLVPLFALREVYETRLLDLGIERPPCPCDIQDARGLLSALRWYSANSAEVREIQQDARTWWGRYFSAEPITKRLLEFYEGL